MRQRNVLLLVCLIVVAVCSAIEYGGVKAALITAIVYLMMPFYPRA